MAQKFQELRSTTFMQPDTTESRRSPDSLTEDETLSKRDPFDPFLGDPNFVLSLARGLRVIEVFEGRTEGLTVADVARETGFSRAAVRRVLITLELLGYSETTGRVYRLRPRVLKLGFSYLSSTSLSAIAQPVLERVTEAVHESSSLSVLDDDQIVYLARSTAKRVMSVGLSVGSRLPAYCTSMGRVLLAALPDEELTAFLDRLEVKALTPKTIVDKSLLLEIIRRVRTDGFALADEELELGLRSIAVPVKTRTGRVIAAMNTGVHAARVSAAEMVPRFLPVLEENAQALGRCFG
jgi:IclR family transcriptional regulator, pca regulon regulatory protein